MAAAIFGSMDENSSVETLTIGIVGQGYVGLPLARAFISMGAEVVGLEKNVEICRQLNLGISHIEDVSNQAISSMNSTGRYRVSTDFTEISRCSTVILCVPTPIDRHDNPDLTLLTQAVEQISPNLTSGTLLISESTSFPGTLRNVIRPLVEKFSKDGVSISYATAPERVDPGNLDWNHRNTPRLISGLDQEATTRAIRIYSLITDNPIPVSSPEVAEASKLLENSFRLVNIAFINEFARAMYHLGINALEVVEGAATKPYGFMKFTPGLGAGGHCIPVDPRYLSHSFSTQAIPHPILLASLTGNSETPDFVLSQVRKLEPRPTRILLLGMAYKFGISDLRESPSIRILERLESEFNEVHFFDEKIMNIGDRRRGDSMAGYDLVLILVKQSSVDCKRLVEDNDLVLNCTGASLKEFGIRSLFDSD